MESIALVDWALASRAAEEGSPNGDAALVQARGADVLVAAIDGLGHGPDAAISAQMAREILEAYPEAPLTSLPRLCHQRLRQAPRGVTMTLALIEGGAPIMTWLGVGNVQGVRASADPQARREILVSRRGIVGRNLPQVMAQSIPLRTGDLVVFATDGIRPEFIDDVIPDTSPRDLADRILARHHRGADDGLVLAVALRGATP